MGVQLSTQEIRNGSDAGSGVPTEECPEFGRIRLVSVALSEGKRWIEDDVHFIESTEFEIAGQGDSLDEAVADFIGHSVDYLKYLARLAEEGDATEHEARILGELSSRFVDAQEKFREQEEIRKRKLFSLTLNLGRRHSRQRPQNWLPSARNISKHLSHA